jgi:hypothetical protein
VTLVYIVGPDRAIEVSEWIKDNLKDCKYDLELDPTNPFSNKYTFKFESSKDATMVALTWGNEYGRIPSNHRTSSS